MGLPLEEGMFSVCKFLIKGWSKDCCCYGSDVVGSDRVRSQIGALHVVLAYPVNPCGFIVAGATDLPVGEATPENYVISDLICRLIEGNWTGE